MTYLYCFVELDTLTLEYLGGLKMVSLSSFNDGGQKNSVVNFGHDYTWEQITNDTVEQRNII